MIHHGKNGTPVGEKRGRIDVGLQLSRAFMHKYHFTTLPRQVIALWCGCTGENIRLIEERALRKLRRYSIFQFADLDYVARLNGSYHPSDRHKTANRSNGS